MFCRAQSARHYSRRSDKLSVADFSPFLGQPITCFYGASAGHPLLHKMKLLIVFFVFHLLRHLAGICCKCNCNRFDSFEKLPVSKTTFSRVNMVNMWLLATPTDRKKWFHLGHMCHCQPMWRPYVMGTFST